MLSCTSSGHFPFQSPRLAERCIETSLGRIPIMADQVAGSPVASRTRSREPAKLARQLIKQAPTKRVSLCLR